MRTEEPGEAIAISRAGVGERAFSAVAVLGGDGAVNEVANGLAGTDVPLAPLPAGRTNVLCRSLGLPQDARGAAIALARAGGRLSTRRIGLGTVNGRAFTFFSGIGLSAMANRRLSGRGATGRTLGGHLFLYEALAVAASYLRDPPRLAVTVEDRETEIEGVTLIVQNGHPLTYLGRRPLPLCEGAGLETGTLSLAVLRRGSLQAAATITPLIALGRGAAVLARDDVASVPSMRRARVRTLDGRPLALEVDGDYLGELEAVDYGVLPRALAVVVPQARS
ncbi:MAG: hypothetical protein AVDCRST_MAG45-1978 [uncultured Solirubrobacterales bacterium]|uniref:DAGKc domain-containing protein n=1 Tax=uncultured Solirubrobacterales bacterium TaxID=768556 RepID=A0A6J4T3H9_9ACTN|nr:MAG: hypothetical protein AVDCRST_MAG45-1978 [uncultured Solirubrobacterales bacterium]